MLEECVKLREEILGPDYPDTRMAAQALQRCRSTTMVKLDAVSRQQIDSALWSAAAAGNATRVQKMLEAGASPDVERDGFPALCVSAVGGHIDTVALLCGAGAMPDAVVKKAQSDVHGATAMYLAAHGGHAEIIKLLVEAGGIVDVALPQNGCTPLYMAADIGHADAVEVLLAAGADVHRTNASGASCVCAAARSGHSTVLTMLASAGADLDRTMDNGAAPAHLAAMAGQSEVLVTLHTLGADMDKAALVRGQEQTPLQLAQHYGQIAAVDSLEECLAASYHIVLLQARMRAKMQRRKMRQGVDKA